MNQPSLNNPSPPPAPPRKLSRRAFFKWLFGAGAAMGGAAGYAWRIEPHWIEVVRRDMPIANLPDSLAGRTIALISDLHIGHVVDADYIRSAMGRINALRPDLVAIVGDLMTATGREQIDNAVDVVGRLNRPPLGIFAVPGNHDYGLGWMSPSIAARLADRLAERGITMLRNQVADAGGLQVVGVDDYWANDGFTDESKPGQFFHPEQALSKLDASRPAIALVHNPDAVDAPGWGGYRGWVLAGHTHGGQVCLPLIGPLILPVKNRRYAKGEVDLGDGRRLYVSRGLGYLKRVRLLSRPEITLFTLSCLKAAPTTRR